MSSSFLSMRFSSNVKNVLGQAQLFANILNFLAKIAQILDNGKKNGY